MDTPRCIDAPTPGGRLPSWFREGHGAPAATPTAHRRATALSPPVAAVARGDAGAVLRAPAADLYLILWNRAEPGPGVFSGDGRALSLWRESAQVRWKR
ncbi:hypothetical protein SUDANB121_00505 [Nocardiopsis dassonvillei]|uniref:hypothetical protein n=1 Tax=Nocardiopsis dassonvillei TaxID=2014 RepID=UPI003F57B8F6